MMDDPFKPLNPAPQAADDVAPALDPIPLPKPAFAPANAAPEPTDELMSDAAYEGAVENDKAAHYRPSYSHISSAWVQSPGAITLLAEASHDLNTVAALRSTPATRVAFVRALALPAIKTLLIWPTDEKDPQKIEVSWRGGHASFSASEVLIRAKIPVESRRRKRFEVRIAKETKVGPALAIDMRYLVDLRVTQKGKSTAKGKGKQGEHSKEELNLDEE